MLLPETTILLIALLLVSNSKLTLLLVLPSESAIHLFVPSFAKEAISAYNTPSVEFIKLELPAPNAASAKRVTVLPFVGIRLVAYDCCSN